MSKNEVLIVVPDAELQRSVAFALEAEGLDVIVAAQLSDGNARGAICSAGCSVVDECAIAEPVGDLRRLIACNRPIVLLVDAMHHVPPELMPLSVVKPFLGRQLVDAVVRSLHAGTAPPATT